jgi:glycosyltransferase involved in cell wall biosynthesis
MVNICIDGFNIALAKGTGIASYGRNLLKGAQSAGFGTQVLYGASSPRHVNKVINETALVEVDKPARKLKKSDRFRRTLLSRYGHTPWGVEPSEEVIWPSRSGGRPTADYFWNAQNLFAISGRAFDAYGVETPVRFDRTDPEFRPSVMHWTSTLPLYATGAPNVYTIHDLIPLRLPHTTMDNTAKYMDLCKGIAKRADHIAVVSEATKQDVMRLLGVSEDRITNTYQAVNLPRHLLERPQAEVALELEGIFNLGWKDYFLHFGAIEPKKNLGRTVEAYLSSGVSTPLVVVGGRAWLFEAETALLDQVKREGGASADRIRHYEYMPLSMLVSLIRGAKATLFPSLYEGFGLPVLESLMLGTAVITSTAGALPEIAGEAAICVDPYNTQEITKAIQMLDADADLRNEYVSRGHTQAMKFTPEIYRQRICELYAKVGVRADT